MYQLFKEIPITLTIATATLMVFLIPGLEGVLDYQTNAPALHQLLQIFTCHTAHWSFDHLIWDLVMFVTMGVICERRNSTQFAIVLILSAISDRPEILVVIEPICEPRPLIPPTIFSKALVEVLKSSLI